MLQPNIQPIPRSQPFSDKPDILEVVGTRVDLRRAGKELLGRCPFHNDKTPSFSVNPDKGVFHCFGCGESGDVFDFIMRLDGLSFPEAKRAWAKRALGITDNYCKPAPMPTPEKRRAAALAAAWTIEQRIKFNAVIAEVMEQRDLADRVGDDELWQSFDRELTLLKEFYDSLEYPAGVVEMLAMRPSIENITHGAEVAL